MTGIFTIRFVRYYQARKKNIMSIAFIHFFSYGNASNGIFFESMYRDIPAVPWYINSMVLQKGLRTCGVISVI